MSAERLVLWRHGRTSYNHDNRWQGQLDVPLDDVGQAQAQAGAAAVRVDPGGWNPMRVVSSDLSRASETAAALGLPVELDAGLREVFAGEWQGLLRDGDRRAVAGRSSPPGGGGTTSGRVGESRVRRRRRGRAAAVRRFAGEMAGGTLVVVGPRRVAAGRR